MSYVPYRVGIGGATTKRVYTRRRGVPARSPGWRARCGVGGRRAQRRRFRVPAVPLHPRRQNKSKHPRKTALTRGRPARRHPPSHLTIIDDRRVDALCRAGGGRARRYLHVVRNNIWNMRYACQSERSRELGRLLGRLLGRSSPGSSVGLDKLPTYNVVGRRGRPAQHRFN